MRKNRSIDDYTKEELYNLLLQDEITIKLLQQEISDIKDMLRLINSTVNSGKVVINNYGSNLKGHQVGF